jgi:hypothetical protein
MPAPTRRRSGWSSPELETRKLAERRTRAEPKASETKTKLPVPDHSQITRAKTKRQPSQPDPPDSASPPTFHRRYAPRRPPRPCRQAVNQTKPHPSRGVVVPSWSLVAGPRLPSSVTEQAQAAAGRKQTLPQRTGSILPCSDGVGQRDDAPRSLRCVRVCVCWAAGSLAVAGWLAAPHVSPPSLFFNHSLTLPMCSL